MEDYETAIEKAPYLEVAIGSVDNRNHIVHYTELPKIVESRPDTEVYRSYYFYDESRVGHEGKAKEYMGKRYVHDLHFDYDGEDALDRARTMYKKLVGLGVDPDLIWVWFSGNKGFHVWIPDVFGFEPSMLVHKDVRQTLVEFAPGVDTKPMAQNGLIRAEWSYHAKSGLYKVPVGKKELFAYKSMDTYKDEALFKYQIQKENGFPRQDLEYLEENTPLSEFKIVDLERDISPVKQGGVKTNTYFGCMTKLWNRGAVQGRRHQDLLRQVTYWRHVGLTANQAWELGVAWTAHTDWGTEKAKTEVASMVNWAYETAAYHHSCTTDEVMLEFCIGERCPLHKYRSNQAEAEDMASAGDKYREMLSSDHGGFNLNELYGPNHPYSIRDGEVAILLADTKIGKSSLFLNWAIQLNRLRWLIITPEMKVEDMVERSLQISKGLRVNDEFNINEVADLAMTGNGQFSRAIDDISHIKWITSPPYLEDMNKIVAQASPDVVVIDPLEMIHMKSGDDQNKLADGMRALANQHRVPLLVIHHINKEGQKEGGSVEIQSWMSKGFKRIQEQVDHVWKLEGTHDSVYRRLGRVMGRRPQKLMVPLKGDKETFKFSLDQI